MEDVSKLSKPTEKKMTLAPPKKKDNPKVSKQIKKKETNNKKRTKLKKTTPNKER